MKVLVIGNGGREHALAWKLGQSVKVDRVFVAPGNAGTARDAENVDIPATDIAGLIQFAKDQAIDLTVIGPEAPLVAGLAYKRRSHRFCARIGGRRHNRQFRVIQKLDEPC